jgi:hypothetical protein
MEENKEDNVLDLTISDKFDSKLYIEEEDSHISKEHIIKCFNWSYVIILSNCIIFLFIIIISGEFNHNLFPFEIRPINKWQGQVSNFLFFMSYWTSNVILLRSLAITAYAFSIYGIIEDNLIPAMDIFIWTFIFFILNISRILILLYNKRKIVFDEYREQIYKNVFDGIMSRADFKKLSKRSLLRELDTGRFYSQIGDKCGNLSILIIGRMKVDKGIKDDLFIEENEFIDSSQWMLRKHRSGKRFTYSIQANVPCIYITWPREILNDILNNNEELKQPLMGALGLDVSNKVLLHEIK